jgi:beta-aspartyl-peptidase (threonine type)
MTDDRPQLLRLTWSFLLGLVLVEAAFAALILAGCWAIWRGGGTTRDDVPAVRALLAEQAAAWNRGDLDGFMIGYWNDERLTFASGTEVTRGWQATYDRYHKKYREGGQQMGSLTFSRIDVFEVDDGLATARGAWHLDFPGGKTAGGRFALVLRRFDGAWRVVYDHTTAHQQ